MLKIERQSLNMRVTPMIYMYFIGKLKFRINFLKNLFFYKKNFFIFFKFKKITLKSVEANFVSKCFILFLVKYKKLFLK